MTTSLLAVGCERRLFHVWKQKNTIHLIVLHTIPSLHRWATNTILVLGRPQLSHLKNEGVGPDDLEGSLLTPTIKLKKSFKQSRGSQNKRKVGGEILFF